MTNEEGRIRKIVVVVDEVVREAGREVSPPTRRAVAAAVIENPYPEYSESLEKLEALGETLGERLATRALRALGIDGSAVESYGKAAMVGEDGEIEHAAAVLHPRLGKGLRGAIGGGKALIPSTKKQGSPGQSMVVPVGHKDAAFVRSHFDAIEFSINDAPRRNEMVVAVALTDSGRPLARVGGLAVSEIKGEDGLR